MVVACLVPEVIRRPEHALWLIETLEASGIHSDELLSGLRALRVVRDPGVLAAMGRIGRRWGAYDDVFCRLLDEVRGNPRAMTPELTLDIAKTNYALGEQTH